MVGGHFVAPNPLQYLAAGLRSIGGMTGEKYANEELQALGQKERDLMGSETKALAQALRGTQGPIVAPATPNDDEGNINPQVQMQGTQGSFAAFTDRALQSEFPQFQKLGMQGIMKMPEIEAKQQERIADREFKMQQIEQNRQDKLDQLKIQHDQRMEYLAQNNADRAALAAEQRAFQASLAQANRDFQATMADNKTNATAKTLPVGALKMQQEGLDAIGVVSGINADLSAVEKQIDDKKLKFGPISNLANTALNASGLSTAESKNFSSFKSNMERLRNESLRLNTGVQTDGDAQRAWNELFQNINDTGLVKQRLQEIQKINSRGAELQKLKVDSIRANYGNDPYNFDALTNQKPSLNGGVSGNWGVQGQPQKPQSATQNNTQPKGRIKFDAQGNIIQ
jgi:hypothetical protein